MPLRDNAMGLPGAYIFILIGFISVRRKFIAPLILVTLGSCLLYVIFCHNSVCLSVPKVTSLSSAFAFYSHTTPAE